ncbi:MAG: hypothetical protein ACXACY_17000 [Candidatus Hodarchaeales archaeon]|jgi:hypothetical protein
MIKNSELVFIGWLKLTDSEKEEVLEEIKKFQSLTYYEQRSLTEKKTEISTGPLGGICPCCGR